MARNPKKVFVFLDRDGTLIYDDKYYLGSQRNWKELIRFLPGVIKCVKMLRKIKSARIFMITNQPGVAVKELPLLTLKRANSVCEEVLARMENQGAKLDGYFVCPHASPSYVRSHPQFSFQSHYVCNCSCMKPRSGMVEWALSKYGLSRKDARIYVIGDRASDALAGIHAGGFGLLVPFANEPNELSKFSRIKSNKKYLAKNFCDAVRFILSKEAR